LDVDRSLAPAAFLAMLPGLVSWLAASAAVEDARYPSGCENVRFDRRTHQGICL